VCIGERGKERRQRESHPNQNQRSQECLQTSPDEREAFVQKRGKAARRRGVRRPFEPQVAMCRAKNRKLLTIKNQVLARWKEHFEEHLTERSAQEQPPRPVDLRDDGGEIDLPSREEIEGALKYLKYSKASSADSIAAKLLKNGGPNLVDA
jgi:hypothetical protein